MKITNTTDFHDMFLRRMIGWVCRQVGYPVSQVTEAVFRNRSDSSYSGRAFLNQRRIVVSVRMSMTDARRALVSQQHAEQWAVGRINDLLTVTSHEIIHLWMCQERIGTRRSRRYGTTSPGGSERHVEGYTARVVAAFDARRDELIAAWTPVPRPTKPTQSLSDRRRAKVEAALARWQRKLKLAQTKIRKLKAKARYYDRREATTLAEAEEAEAREAVFVAACNVWLEAAREL